MEHSSLNVHTCTRCLCNIFTFERLTVIKMDNFVPLDEHSNKTSCYLSRGRADFWLIPLTSSLKTLNKYFEIKTILFLTILDHQATPTLSSCPFHQSVYTFRARVMVSWAFKLS